MSNRDRVNVQEGLSSDARKFPAVQYKTTDGMRIQYCVHKRQIVLCVCGAKQRTSDRDRAKWNGTVHLWVRYWGQGYEPEEPDV